VLLALRGTKGVDKRFNRAAEKQSSMRVHGRTWGGDALERLRRLCVAPRLISKGVGRASRRMLKAVRQDGSRRRTERIACGDGDKG